MAICVVAGTSSNVEPTWPAAVGSTATDGTVQWKRIHELQGVTKGAGRESTLRDHTQTGLYNPTIDGRGNNQYGFPVRGSLLVGGKYAAITARSLTFQAYAGGALVTTQNITSRVPFRLPRGFLSDSWEFRLAGNIAVRYFKVATTSQELGKLDLAQWSRVKQA